MKPSFLFGISVLLFSTHSIASDPQSDPLPRKGALGAGTGPIPADQVKLHKLKPNQGILIARVVAGSSAEKAGMKVGDILLTVQGKAITNAMPLALMISKLPSNVNVKYGILRGSEKLTLESVLQERPKQSSTEFDVEYGQVTSLGKRIRVMSTHPKGPGKYPTIFWIGGIGAYSLDGNFENISYGNIMAPLAKAGFAIVRIDKPGQGDSDGPIYTNLGFNDELDAYRQALKYTKTLNFVDPNRVGIFGHSMGGAFGPIIASEIPVAAIAVGGTIAKTWMEYWIENIRRQSTLGGASPESVDESAKQIVALNTYLFYEKLSPAEVIRKHPELKDAMNGMSPDGKTMSGVGIPFFQELASYNLVKAWTKVDAKALLFWGENDFVSTRYDHEYVVEFMNKRRPNSATFKVLEQSDHGFTQTTSMQDSMQKWGRGGTHNPNIENTLIEWFRSAMDVK